MKIFRWLLSAGGLATGLFLIWRFGPLKSGVGAAPLGYFPEVSGTNLDRQDFTFPQDAPKEFSLIFVAFLQRQQDDVNTWIPFAQRLEQSNDRIIYYEFPTINEMGPMRRTFINEGMRAGIPDPLSRQRTITLYLNKQRFLKQLEIDDQSEIQVYLVRQDGEIVWRTRGRFTSEARAAIEALIEE